MHTIKITPNLLFEYQCTSGKFIRLPNRKNRFGSENRIESKLFLPELECSIFYKSVNCNPLTLLRVVKLLITVDKISTDTARRAVRLR